MSSSNLSEINALCLFPWLHLKNFMKRIVYIYFLRSFSLASLNLVFGLVLLSFGSCFGLVRWVESLYQSGVAATAGTVMLAALPLVLGTQLVLSFLLTTWRRAPAFHFIPAFQMTWDHSACPNMKKQKGKHAIWKDAGAHSKSQIRTKSRTSGLEGL